MSSHECWDVNFDGCRSGPCCPDLDAPENATVKALAGRIAASILWSLTGRQFGCCPELTVRPCKPLTCDPQTLTDIIYWDQAHNGAGNMGVYSYTPTLIAGQPYNIACGCPSGCCKCKADCEVFLPGPVCEVKDVVIGQTHLGKNAYTMYAGNKLVLRNTGVQVQLPVNTVPLPDGISQVTAFNLAPALGGVQLTDIGSTYQFQLDDAHTDVQWIVEIPVGNATTDLHIFQPQNFDYVVLDGGNPTITEVSSSHLQIGPATIPDTRVKILFRAPKDALNVNSIIMLQDAPQNSGIVLTEVQYTDYAAGECGVRVIGPVAPASEMRVLSADPTPGYDTASFGTPPAAFVANDDGFGNFSAINASTPMSFTFPEQGTVGSQALKGDSPGTGGTHVWTLAGVDLSWPAGPVVGVTPITSNVNSAGYYAVLTPLGLGTGEMTAAGPRVAVGDNVFQYEVEFFQNRKTSDICCPPCQDYNKPLGEEGTWSVTYSVGYEVPEDLLFAAGLLACEIGKSLVDDTTCKLPSNVQRVTRQGVDINFLDPQMLTLEGLTGIPLVDLIVRQYNPNRLMQESTVWSPDLKRVRREL